MNTQES